MGDPQAIAEARRWLRFAREDLAQAEAITKQDSPIWRHACWFAQQAAEKALKAGLIFKQIDFPRTHDLAKLRSLFPEGWAVKDTRADLAGLTEWAAEARYPGDWPEATRSGAEAAISSARQLLSEVVRDLKARGCEP